MKKEKTLEEIRKERLEIALTAPPCKKCGKIIRGKCVLDNGYYHLECVLEE